MVLFCVLVPFPAVGWDQCRTCRFRSGMWAPYTTELAPGSSSSRALAAPRRGLAGVTSSRAAQAPASQVPRGPQGISILRHLGTWVGLGVQEVCRYVLLTKHLQLMRPGGSPTVPTSASQVASSSRG